MNDISNRDHKDVDSCIAVICIKKTLMTLSLLPCNYFVYKVYANSSRYAKESVA